MSIASTFWRLIFYGMVYAVGWFVFSKIDLQITGSVGWRLFGSFAFISAIIQGINLVIIKNIRSIEDIEGIGAWARKLRLLPELKRRRKATILRAIIGIALAAVTGTISAYMFTVGQGTIPTWSISVSAVSILLSILMLVLTYYEFYMVNELESDLAEKARKSKSKQEALKSLNGVS